MILANLLLAKFVLDTTIWRNLVQQNVAFVKFTKLSPGKPSFNYVTIVMK